MDNHIPLTFKKDDIVTCIGDSNWLIGEDGIVKEVLPMDDPRVKEDRNIVVVFPHIPKNRFLSHNRHDTLKDETGWVYFSSTEIELGRKLLSFEEEIRRELLGFGSSMAPYRCWEAHKRNDGLCHCEGCTETATVYIWINIWGSGFRYYVCVSHAQEYDLCSCRDDIPFKVKAEEGESNEIQEINSIR